MTRFSWEVEDGLSAFLPPGAYAQHQEGPDSVRHATCEIEVLLDPLNVPVDPNQMIRLLKVCNALISPKIYPSDGTSHQARLSDRNSQA